MTGLMPCHCGCAGEPRRDAPSYPYFVEKVFVICRGCGVQTPLCDTVEQATTIWNRRSTPATAAGAWIQGAAEEIDGMIQTGRWSGPNRRKPTERQRDIAALIRKHSGASGGGVDASVMCLCGHSREVHAWNDDSCSRCKCTRFARLSIHHPSAAQDQPPEHIHVTPTGQQYGLVTHVNASGSEDQREVPLAFARQGGAAQERKAFERASDDRAEFAVDEACREMRKAFNWGPYAYWWHRSVGDPRSYDTPEAEERREKDRVSMRAFLSARAVKMGR